MIWDSRIFKMQSPKRPLAAIKSNPTRIGAVFQPFFQHFSRNWAFQGLKNAAP